MVSSIAGTGGLQLADRPAVFLDSFVRFRPHKDVVSRQRVGRRLLCCLGAFSEEHPCAGSSVRRSWRWSRTASRPPTPTLAASRASKTGPSPSRGGSSPREVG